MQKTTVINAINHESLQFSHILQVFILKKDTLKTKKGIFMYHFKFLILVILELIILDSYSITFLEAQLKHLIHSALLNDVSVKISYRTHVVEVG